MLPKKNRITRKDFPAPPKQGFRLFSELFSGLAYPEKSLPLRVSVVVSKKTAKLAVTRNTLKRRFYTAIQPLIENCTQGALVVLYPKKGSEKTSITSLRGELAIALKKAKIL